MPKFGSKKSTKPIWSGPLMANNRLIVVGSSGELVALNAKTGEVQRRVSLGEPAMLAPIAAGNTIYVLTDTAQLIALR
jgi:outer membrane protein assembly factor BamB